MRSQYPPSVPLAILYERESAKGTRYFVGRLGLAKIVMFQGEDTDDGTPTWDLLIQQPSPKNENQQPRPAGQDERNGTAASRASCHGPPFSRTSTRASAA